MKYLLACLLLCAPAAAAPRIVPSRDVTVAYIVRPPDHAPLSVRVSIAAGGRLLRVTGEDIPTAFLIDLPAETATILLPMLKLYATVGIGQYDPERTILHEARFVRHGHERLAGLVCTDWTSLSPHGTAQACITDDGVILRGSAVGSHGALGSVLASNVHYGRLPTALFQRPEGFKNAGSLPVEGFGGQ